MGCLAVGTVRAADYTWDGGGGNPSDGGGTWDTTTANWWNGASVAWPNTTSDNAIIGAGSGPAGTVTVSGTLNNNVVTFNAPGSGNYALTGGTLNFGGTAPTINVNNTATISSPMMVNTGVTTLDLVVANGQTLTLGGNFTANNGTRVTVSGGGTVELTDTIGGDGFFVFTLTHGTLAITGSSTFRDAPAGNRIANAVVIDVVDSGSTFDLNSAGDALGYLRGGGSVSLGSGSITLDMPETGNNATFAGVISGTGGLTLRGSLDPYSGNDANQYNRQILSGNNTYSGTTTINKGTLRVSHDNALGSTVAGTFVDGNRTRLEVYGGITIAEPITIQSGGGAGRITGGSGGATMTAAVTLNADTDLRGDDLHFSGGISSVANQGISCNGSRYIVDTSPIDLNAGTLTITSVGNNKANATQLNVGGNDWGLARINFGGYLLLGGDDFMPTDVGVEFGWHVDASSSGVLDLNGFNQTVTFLRQTTFFPDVNGDQNVTGGGTLTINTPAGTYEYHGRITDGATPTTIIKNGTGTQILENNTGTTSSYTGPTTVNNGILRLQGVVGFWDGVVPNTSLITVENGAELNVAGNWNTLMGNVAVVNGGTLNFSAGIATDANNYLNTITLNDGAQIIGNPVRMGFQSDGAVTVGGTSAATISSGVMLVNSGGAPLREVTMTVPDVTSDASTDLLVSGNISDHPAPYDGATLRKAGDGTMTLTGANTYAGATTVDGGVLEIQNGSAVGDASAVTVNASGTFEVDNNETIGSLAGAGDVTLNDNLTLSANATTTVSGDITGSGALVKDDLGTLTLSGNNTFSGGITMNNAGGNSGGTLSLNSANAAGTGDITLNHFTHLYNDALGPDTLSNDLNTSGWVFWDAGSKALEITGDWNNSCQVVWLNSANTLTISGVVSGTAGTGFYGGGTLALTNPNNNYTGNHSFTLNSTIQFATIADSGVNSSLGAGTTLVFDGGNQSFNGYIENIGAGGSTDRAITIGSTAAASEAGIANNGTGALNFSGTFSNNAGGGGTRTLLLGGNYAGENTISSDLSDGAGTGKLALTKDGTTTWILSAANTYSGPTAVNAGTLEVTGAISNSAVDIASGATLRGTGSVGDTTVNNGALLTPGTAGTGIATLDATSLTLETGGTIDWQLTDAAGVAGTGYDLIQVGDGTGAVTDNATSGNPFVIRIDDVGLVNFNNAQSYSWTIIDGGSWGGGFSADAFTLDTNDWDAATGEGEFFLTENDGDLVLNFVALFMITHGDVPAAEKTEVTFTTANHGHYDVIYVDAVDYSDGLVNSWQHLTSVTATSSLTSVIDTGAVDRTPPAELTGSAMRFYRAAIKDRWQPGAPSKFVSEEVYVSKASLLRPGQNWVAFPGIPDTNTLAAAIGHDLPAGDTCLTATCLSWYERTTTALAFNQVWLSSDPQWTYAISNGVTVAGGNADELALPLEEGFIVELPAGSPAQSLLMVGQIPLTDQVQTLPGDDKSSLLSVRLPRSLGPGDLFPNADALPASGFFTGGTIPPKSDRVWKYDRNQQRVPNAIWYDTGSSTWRFSSAGFPAVPDNYFRPDDGIYYRSLRSTVDLTWTNAIPYTAPTRSLNP